jgi:hypothetical protein
MALTKFNTPLKSQKKLEIDSSYFNIIKDIFNNPIANIILNGGKLKHFSKIKNEKDCPISPLLLNAVQINE